MHRPVFLTWVLLFLLSLKASPQQNRSYQQMLFDFDLVPVSIKQVGESYQIDSVIPIERFMTPGGDIVFHDGDYFSFQLQNHSDKTLHYIIYDIIPGKSYSPLINGFEDQLSLNPGDSVVLDQIYYFTEPYGCEMFALVYSEDPIVNNPAYIGDYLLDMLGRMLQFIPPQNWMINNHDMGNDSLCFGIETISVTISDGDNINMCQRNVKDDREINTNIEVTDTEVKDWLINQLFNKQIYAHTALMNTRGNIDDKGEVMLSRMMNYFAGAIYRRGIVSIPNDHKSIMYYYSDDTLHYALIGNKGIVELGKTGLTIAMIDELILAIQQSIYHQQNKKRVPRNKRGVELIQGSELSIDYDSAITVLSQELLPDPICQALTNNSHLEIIPEQNLGVIPFCLLQPFGNGSYLIDSLSLSISSNMFDMFSFSHSPWNWGFSSPLLIGNPEYPKDKEWVFPQLPGAEKEVMVIGELLNTHPITGARATLSQIKQSSEDADLLYFATHGVSESEEALKNSFLIFAASENNDGKWKAIDIMAQDLDAKLAVLSACQTGLGQTHRGGIIGLARAFQEAGVPRVMMSLWSVGDESTGTLMKLFMTYLNQNSPARALQLAMIAYKKEENNPYNWGAFTLFGFPY